MDPYETYNKFFSIIEGDKNIRKQIDYGEKKSEFCVHQNLSNYLKRQGCVGATHIDYTPQKQYPLIANENAFIYFTPDGIYRGQNKDNAAIKYLQKLSFSQIIAVPPEEVHILSEFINAGWSVENIWNYFSDEKLDKSNLWLPPSGEELGLEKTNWLGAGLALLGDNVNVDLLDELRRLIKSKSLCLAEDSKDIQNYNSPLTLLAFHDMINTGAKIKILCKDSNICIGKMKESAIKRYKEPLYFDDGSKIQFVEGVIINSTKSIFKLAEKYNRPVLWEIAEMAAAKEQQNFETTLFRGYCLYKSGNWEEALQLCKYACKIAKPFQKPVALNCTGYMLYNLGDIKGAIEILKESAKLDKKGTNVYSNLGQACLVLGIIEGNIQWVKMAENYYKEEHQNNHQHPFAERMISQVKKLEDTFNLNKEAKL